MRENYNGKKIKLKLWGKLLGNEVGEGGEICGNKTFAYLVLRYNEGC